MSVSLNCSNSIFNNKHYLQIVGVAQGPHMSYGDITLLLYDSKTLSYEPTQNWKRFCDGVLVLWKHSREDVDCPFNFMNSINPSKPKRIPFTLFSLTDSVLEILDLALSFDDTLKSKVLKLFVSPTNSFDYDTRYTIQ